MNIIQYYNKIYWYNIYIYIKSYNIIKMNKYKLYNKKIKYINHFFFRKRKKNIYLKKLNKYINKYNKQTNYLFRKYKVINNNIILNKKIK